MKKIFRSNKKGSWMEDHLGQIVLTALMLGVGIYFIWAYLVHGAGDSVSNLQQCGALTGSQGSCKETCDSALEFEFTDIGCKGLANKCCVPKNDNLNDVILPAGYGGRTNEYGFEVTGIRFSSSLPSGCAIGNEKDPTIHCTPGQAYKIPVIVEIRNTYKGVTVYADPVAIINGNGRNIRGPGKYLDTTKSVVVNQGGSAQLQGSVSVTAADAKLNEYWEIYGYAMCSTSECKSTDSKSRGILAFDDSKYVTVKFIN